MKKLLLFLVMIITINVSAQSTTWFGKPLELDNVPASTSKSDSILVRGVDKIIKYLPISEIKSITNLDYLATPTGGTVFSSSGKDAVIPIATTTDAGLLSPSEKIKLINLQGNLNLNLKQNIADKNISNGYAGLDSSGKILLSQIPEMGVTSFKGRVGVVIPVNGDYDTGIIPEVEGKRYQTEAQRINNDATSSIQTQLDSKAGLDSPIFTGTPTVPTGTLGIGSTQIANTSFVISMVNTKAGYASPTFTGTPSTPTATIGVSSFQIANGNFVMGSINQSLSNYLALDRTEPIPGGKSFNYSGGGSNVTCRNLGNGNNIFMHNTGTGTNLILDNSTTATGMPFTISKNQSEKLTISDSGVITIKNLNAAPASASDVGATGEIRFTSTHIYICTGVNTWKRVALSTW